MCAALALTGCSPWRTLVGEVVTSDHAAGVACRIRVWDGDIGPLDGHGTPVAEASLRSGAPFSVDVDVSSASGELLWASVECDGYHVKLRAFERDAGSLPWLPVVELGTVWVPRLSSPGEPTRR